MPITKIDYSNTTIYKLCCKDLDIKEIYVGHTTDMRRRKYRHKSCCINETAKGHNYNVYQYIRENGGWDNFDMIEVERYNAIDGYDATKRERYWIDELKATLNCKLPTRTHKEYREDNKEIISEQRKNHYSNNKEKISEYQKQYFKNNMDKINERNKEYNKNHKEMRFKISHKYYENNKEVISEKTKEKITCECGCVCRKDTLSKHIKTINHIKLINNQIENILLFIECFL